MQPQKKTAYALGAECAARHGKRSPPLHLGMVSRQAWIGGYDKETAYQQAQLELFHGPNAAQEKADLHKGRGSRAPARAATGEAKPGK